MKTEAENAQPATPNAEVRKWKGKGWIVIWVLFVLGMTVAVLLAGDITQATGEPRKPGAMELFGMGPEMFGDRGVQWVKAFSAIIKETITELGFQIAAILLLIDNLKSRKKLKEAKEELKDELGGRLNRHEERILNAETKAGTAPPPPEIFPTI